MSSKTQKKSPSGKKVKHDRTMTRTIAMTLEEEVRKWQGEERSNDDKNDCNDTNEEVPKRQVTIER